MEGLRGTDPQKTWSFLMLVVQFLEAPTRVFIQDLAVVPFSASTTAYDFSDSTGTKFCNSFSDLQLSNCSLLGAGQISGFKAITFVKPLESFKWIKSYW
jgi:hypothetical protein